MHRVALMLLFVAGCGPSRVEARKWLESPDPAKRPEGATILKKAYDKDPKSLGDHGEAYWAERVGRVRGLKGSEALRILEGPTYTGGEAGGGGASENYRLDDFWVVTLHRSTREDDTVFDTKPPRRRVVSVDLTPPSGFNGAWKTYFVNGAVYQSIELDHGVTRLFREYHDSGKLRYERRYVGGKLDGTTVSRDENGVPQWEDTYAAGKQVGVAKMYHPNGAVSQETHFANGELDGLLRNFSPSGTVVYCAAYRAGVQLDGGCPP